MKTRVFTKMLIILYITFLSFVMASCNTIAPNKLTPNTTEEYSIKEILTNTNSENSKPEVVNTVISVTSDPNTGIVQGLVSSYSTKEPLPEIKIYMANKVPLEPEPGYVISFQEKSSPQALTNPHGQFLIHNIPPGEYVILMVTPFGTFPLGNEETNQIELDMKAGDSIDIGAAYVNWP